MKKSRILSLLLAIVLVFSLTACGSNVEPSENEQEPATEEPGTEESAGLDQEFTFQYAFSAAATSPAGIVGNKVKELMEEKSNGKITVEIYPDAQLGGDRELIEAAQNGDIAMISLTTAPMVSFIPKLAVFDMPMALSNLSVAAKVVQSDNPFMDQIDTAYEDAGFELLMMAPDSYRQMSSNVEVREVADFSGIKIRTMENKYHMAFWQELGANPSPLAFSELYIALQQGTVDAQENPYATLMASKLFEQQDYIVNTNHIAFLSTTVMNKELYDSLPDAYKTIVDEVFVEANQYAVEVGKQEADKSLQQIKDAGLEVIDLPESVLAEMQEKAAPVYDMIKEDIGAELVDSLLSALEEAK